jgi:hypothetical protein
VKNYLGGRETPEGKIEEKMVSKNRREYLAIADLVGKNGKWKEAKDLTPEQRKRVEEHQRDTHRRQDAIKALRHATEELDPTGAIAASRILRREEIRKILNHVLVDVETPDPPKPLSAWKKMWLAAATCILPKEFRIEIIPVFHRDERVLDRVALLRLIEDLWESRLHESKIDPEILRLDDVAEVEDEDLINFPSRLEGMFTRAAARPGASVTNPHHVDAGRGK